MAVYIINNLVIHDHEEYGRYEHAFLATFLPFDGEVLAVRDDPKPHEGEWPFTRTVLLRMPSEDVMQAWYESDGYQAIVKLRLDATVSNVVVLPEFKMPGRRAA